jgi:hypothetical protein
VLYEKLKNKKNEQTDPQSLIMRVLHDLQAEVRELRKIQTESDPKTAGNSADVKRLYRRPQTKRFRAAAEYAVLELYGKEPMSHERLFEKMEEFDPGSSGRPGYAQKAALENYVLEQVATMPLRYSQKINPYGGDDSRGVR